MTSNPYEKMGLFIRNKKLLVEQAGMFKMGPADQIWPGIKANVPMNQHILSEVK